jgi:hypothetical protein
MTSQIATRAERFIEWSDAVPRVSVTASRADPSASRQEVAVTTERASKSPAGAGLTSWNDAGCASDNWGEPSWRKIVEGLVPHSPRIGKRVSGRRCPVGL